MAPFKENANNKTKIPSKVNVKNKTEMALKRNANNKNKIPSKVLQKCKQKKNNDTHEI